MFSKIFSKFSNKLYVVSYPRSGRCWFEYIFEQCYHNKNIIFRHATYDSTILDICPNAVKMPDDKTCLNVILLVNDPRDVICDIYLNRRNKYPEIRDMSFDKFVVHSIYGIEPVVRFYNTWVQKHIGVNKFSILFYKTLITQPEKTIHKICNLLDTSQQISLKQLPLIKNLIKFEKEHHKKLVIPKGLKKKFINRKTSYHAGDFKGLAKPKTIKYMNHMTHNLSNKLKSSLW